MRSQVVALGLGSNLLQPIQQLRLALQYLKQSPGLKVLDVSSIYESQAQLPSQADTSWNLKFLNAVVLCEVAVDLKPQDLLQQVKTIESLMGRAPAQRWAPRTIDIDLIYWSGVQMQSESLSLPHSSLYERPFVLMPLLEVWPDCPIQAESAFLQNKQQRPWMSAWVSDKPFQTQKSQNYFWPEMMGVLNVTSDSFSDGGLLLKEESLQQQAAYLVQSGAEILDIGAESTRPGAVRVSEEVEYKNLKWALQIIDDLNLNFQISLDCRHASVIEKIMNEFEIHMINDVGGLNRPDMVKLLKNTKQKIVVMHSLSVPPTDQQVLEAHENPIDVLKDWWAQKKEQLIESGIQEDRLIFDPGIGFGKTSFHNLFMLKNLHQFAGLVNPILIGHSRKSYQNLFSKRPAFERDTETALVTTQLNQAYTQYLRVHDVLSQKMALWI